MSKNVRMNDLQIGDKTILRDDTLNRYFSDIKCHTSVYLTKDEEVKLFTEYNKTKSKDIKDRIVEANLRFVISIAKMCYIKNNTLSIDDYIQWGNIGLIDAVDLFDITRGFKFISYAVFHIRKEIYKHLNEFRRVKIPSNVINFETKINKFGNKFLTENEFSLTMFEIAEHLIEEGLINYSKEFIYGLNAFAGEKSIDEDLNNADEIQIHETIESDEDVSLTDKADNNTMWDSLFSVLTIRERDMVEMYFGIGKLLPESFETIAAIYKLTDSRVNQIILGSIKKLKEHASANEISWCQLV